MADEVGMTAWLKPELDRRAAEDASREMEQTLEGASRLRPDFGLGGGGDLLSRAKSGAGTAGRFAGQVALTRAARGLGIPATLTTGRLFGGGGGGGGGGSVVELLQAQLEVQMEILEELESPGAVDTVLGGGGGGAGGGGAGGGGTTIIPVGGLGRLGGAAGAGRALAFGGAAVGLPLLGGMVGKAGQDALRRRFPESFGETPIAGTQYSMEGLAGETEPVLDFEWPDVPEMPEELSGFEWPELPDVGQELEGFDWPDVPELPDDLGSFEWPELPELPDLPDPLASFEWPRLDAPDWVDDLLGGGAELGIDFSVPDLNLRLDNVFQVDTSDLSSIQHEIEQAIDDAIDELNRRVGDIIKIKLP